jgi:hypothetical protein
VQGGVETTSADYRGSDRRHRSSRPARTVRRDEVLAVIAALLFCAGLLPLGLDQMATAQAQHAQDALRNVWSFLFLAGGLLHLVRWRVTGETGAGIRGAGAVCLGALSAPTTAIAPLLSSSVTTAALSPLSRTIAVVACLSLLTRATHSPVVDSHARPLRTLAMTIAGAWAFIALLVVLAQHHDPVDAGNTGWFAIESAMTLGWLLCGAAAAKRARADHSVSLGWLSGATVLMATAEMCRGLAFVVDSRLTYFSTGVQLVAAMIVLLNATADLTILLSAESRLLHLLSGTVRDTARQLTADERAEAQRRHDARAVLAALRAASLVLDRYDDTLDRETRAELLGSFSGELQRLEQMIERRTDAPLEVFTLDSVIGPALAAIEDISVTADLSPALVLGRPDELAGLVQNVVSTLGRRAGDSRVRVRVTRSTSGVQIACEAAGSNRRGVSRRDGDDDSARNLRLQVVRRIMREQGGDIVVNDRWDGSMSVVLWLRPARETQAPAPAADAGGSEVAMLEVPQSRDTTRQPRLRPRASGRAS